MVERAHWIRVAGTALALALAPALARAQDHVRIDLAEHFPGLVEAFDSDYNAVYRFEEFMGVEGRSVSAAELAEWQARWAAERERAAAAIEALRADPPRHVDFKLRQRLQRHHYFRDRFREEEFRADFRFPPFVLYVQAPKGEDRGTSPEDVERYGRWFQTLEQAFRSEFAEPLGLEMRSTLPGYAIFLLRGRKEYDLYAEELREQGLYLARAHYDPEYRIGVTYQDTQGAAQDSDEIHSAMHEMVHAFQHAYHVQAGEETTTGLATPSWFNEGFAEFLAYRVRMVTEGERRTVPLVPAAEINALVKRWGEPGARCVLPLVQLTQIGDYGQAASIFAETLARGGVSVGEPMKLLGLLYRQSDLWMHFLYDGDGGRHRELLLAYVGAALSGADAREAYARSFAATGPGELDAAFVEFLAENRVEPDAIARLRATRPDPASLPVIPPAPGAGKVTRAAVSADTPVDGPVDAARMLELEPELRLSAALALTAEGRWGAAGDALRALAAAPDTGALAGLVERSRERADALVAMRADFLRHLAAKGSRVALVVDGTRVLARVAGVEGGEVVFDGGEPERAPLDALEPGALCEQVRSARWGYDAPAVVAYPDLLAGAAGWEHALDGSPEAAALRADAAELARLARGADAARALVALAEVERPADRAEAERALLRLAELLEHHGADPRVRGRRAALRALAARAAARTFEAGEPELHVPLERLADGRVRLVYAFEEGAELDDFEPDEGARIEGGALVLTGAVGVRHRLALDAPLTVRMQVRVPVDPDPEKDPRVRLSLAGVATTATGVSDGALELTGPPDEPGQSHTARGDEWPRNRLCTVELVHDGTRVGVRVEGLTTVQTDAGGLSGGAAAIAVRSARPVYVAELALEGRLGAADAARARGPPGASPGVARPLRRSRGRDGTFFPAPALAVGARRGDRQRGSSAAPDRPDRAAWPGASAVAGAGPPKRSLPMPADKTLKVRRDLMDACRVLMRSLLMSRENFGDDWIRRLRMAAKHVEDAARAVDPATSTEREEIERIAGGLARLYMSNLLTEEERRYATESTAANPADEDDEVDELQGSSKAVPIPDLLSFLQMQGASGLLRVDTRHEVITLTFEQGDLTNAYSDNSPPGFRLGEILVELGDIDADKLERFLLGFEPGKEKLGNALQRAGLITAESLELALESQVRLIFLRLLCSEQAHYRFLSSPAEGQSEHRFNVLQLLLDASRIRDEARTG